MGRPDRPVIDHRTSARLLRRWAMLFGLAYPLGVAMALAGTKHSSIARLAAGALVVVLAGWWFGFGRRLIGDGRKASRRGFGYLVGALALFAPTAFLVPECSWVLLGLCPQPFVLRRYREALIWAGVFNGVIPVTALLRADPASVVAGAAAIATGTTAFSFLIGEIVTRIVTQSAERARLITELESSRAAVGELSREAGVTQERMRLAAEIHDTLAQGFVSILALLNAASAAAGPDNARLAELLALAAETARENLAEARAMVGAPTPAPLSATPLAEAVRRQADRTSRECEVAIAVDTAGDLGQLSTQVQVSLLRAVQEGLANIRRHSGARSATIRLAPSDAGVRLVIADDGVGFDPGQPQSGFGLPAMRQRIEQLGGSVTVTTAVADPRADGPSGTTIVVEVPA